MNMLPRSTTNNVPDRSLGHSKPHSYFIDVYALLSQFSNLAYFFVCQLRAPLFLPVYVPPFLSLVVRVDFCIPKEKVTRRYAGWIIATVENVNSFWNRPIKDLIASAVRRIAHVLYVEIPIASRILMGLPYPAGIRVFGDIGIVKEPILGCCFPVPLKPHAFDRTESIISPSYDAHRRFKQFSALLTGLLDGWKMGGTGLRSHTAPPSASPSGRNMDGTPVGVRGIRSLARRTLAVHSSLYPITECFSMEGQKAKTA